MVGVSENLGHDFDLLPGGVLAVRIYGYYPC